TPDSTSVNAILDEAGDSVGLLIDLANWSGPSTCDELAAITSRAETCHAKCRVDETGFGAHSTAVHEYLDALNAIRDNGFTGSLALVYDGADPAEWHMLDQEYALMRQVFR
ncbi:MAG TPA: sugar phosphate isomerase/epimerase, partial [Humibacter sp.]|nr:sugar phosphate isomerase/epimerase [Humibacter sp.]